MVFAVVGDMPFRSLSNSSRILVDDTELDLEWLLLVGVEGGVYVRGLRALVSHSIGEDVLRVFIGDSGGVEQCGCVVEQSDGIEQCVSGLCTMSSVEYSGTVSSNGDDGALS